MNTDHCGGHHKMSVTGGVSLLGGVSAYLGGASLLRWMSAYKEVSAY